MQRFALPIFAWGVALAIIVFFGAGLAQPPSGAMWVAAASIAVAVSLLHAQYGYGLHRWQRDHARPPTNMNERYRGPLVWTVAAFSLLATAAGGGLGSLPVLTIGVPLALVVRWYGLERSLVAGIPLVAAAMLVDLGLGRYLSFSAVVASVAAITLVMLGSRREGRNDEAGLAANESGPPSVASRASLVENETPTVESETPPAGELSKSAPSRKTPTSPSQLATPVEEQTVEVELPCAPMAPDVVATRTRVGTRHWWRGDTVNRLVAEYLLDVRAGCGADDAVVWLHADTGAVLRPFAASSLAGWEDPLHGDERWATIVRWSCDARVIQTGVREDGSRGYVVAPIEHEGKLFGVLCLQSTTAFDSSVESLKKRVSHHAAYIGRLASLLAENADLALRSRSTNAALEAVQKLQESAVARSVAGSPGRAICDSLTSVCQSDGAAFIQWDAEAHTGTVHSASGIFAKCEGVQIESDSVCGESCVRGTALAVSDARDLLSRNHLFCSEERVRQVLSLNIFPLKRGDRLTGLMVVGWRKTNDSIPSLAPSLAILSTVSGGALEAAREIEQVNHTARTDGLTGLLNRRSFDEQLGRVVGEADRYGDSASLILVDIDFFKVVNDTHGHEAGDMVLQHVAETVKAAVRAVDLCARYGGEELAVLLPRTSMEGALELAERIRTAIQMQPVIYNGRQIAVTASLGVATYPKPTRDGASLFSSADRALYRAKAAGRNRVRSAQANS